MKRTTPTILASFAVLVALGTGPAFSQDRASAIILQYEVL